MIKFSRIYLYRNASILYAARLVSVFIGFLFWVLAAKLYTIEDVGSATAIISSVSLIALFSTLGLDVTIIRYIPSKNKNSIFSTCLMLMTLSAIILGTIYIYFINYISPELAHIKQITYYGFVLLLYIVANSIFAAMSQVFVAMRKAEHYLYQNIILGVRLVFIYILSFLGSFGIIVSIGFAYMLASAFSLILLYKLSIKFILKLDKQFVRNAYIFSSRNYISNILFNSPAFILPIIILNLLGGEETAKYYMAFMVYNLVMIAADALSVSLFVEGCYGENLKKNAIRSVLANYLFLIPSVSFIFLYGDLILSFLGPDYVGSFGLLKIFVISSFLVSIYSLFIPIQNVKMNVERIVILNLIRFFLLIGLSYILINEFSLIGVGYAWIVSHGILCMLIAILIKKDMDLKLSTISRLWL